VTLIVDPLTLNILVYRLWRGKNSVPNSSEMEQSAT